VRVPAQQSIELYRALDANGVPARLYVAPREPHGWRELRHGLFKVNVELEWFERWALGREYEWETAPVAGDEKEEEGTEEPESEVTGGGPRAGALFGVEGLDDVGVALLHHPPLDLLGRGELAALEGELLG
jgi:hypothetical protein